MAVWKQTEAKVSMLWCKVIDEWDEGRHDWSTNSSHLRRRGTGRYARWLWEARRLVSYVKVYKRRAATLSMAYLARGKRAGTVEMKENSRGGKALALRYDSLIWDQSTDTLRYALTFLMVASFEWSDEEINRGGRMSVWDRSINRSTETLLRFWWLRTRTVEIEAINRGGRMSAWDMKS